MLQSTGQLCQPYRHRDGEIAVGPLRRSRARRPLCSGRRAPIISGEAGRRNSGNDARARYPEAKEVP